MSVRLTNSEIASLWTQYLTDSMDICVKTHVLATTHDPDVRNLYTHAMEKSKSHLEKITQFFQSEQFPIPIGFTKEDVNEQAPPLFDDIFWVHYLYTMSIYGINGYSLALGASTRSDLRNYYGDCLKESTELLNQSLDLLLEQGVFVRPASNFLDHKVEMIHKQQFFNGWLGEKRPINAIETSHLTVNLQKTSLAKAMCMGFTQVVQTKAVQNFLKQAVESASSHYQSFHSILLESDIPSPPSLEDKVRISSVPPFSEKLMMFHTSQMIHLAIAYYGTALSVSMRRDLGAHYSASIAKLLTLAQDGANILIDHEWMERPPQVPDRK